MSNTTIQVTIKIEGSSPYLTDCQLYDHLMALGKEIKDNAEDEQHNEYHQKVYTNYEESERIDLKINGHVREVEG